MSSTWALVSLGATHLDSGLEIVFDNELLEGAAAQDVGAFANQQRTRLLSQLDGFDARDEAPVVLRREARAAVGHGSSQARDVLRGGATAAADEVQPALVCKTADDLAEHLRSLCVLAVFVGEAGIGNAGHRTACQLGHGAQVVAHQVGSGGAVQTEIEQLSMGQRYRQSLGILATEHGAVGLDGHRHGPR